MEYIMKIRKSYIEQVAQKLGVEIGEIFTTELMEDMLFRFTEEGLTYYDDYNEMWWLTTGMQEDDYTTELLTGEDKVVKLRKVNGNKYGRV